VADERKVEVWVLAVCGVVLDWRPTPPRAISGQRANLRGMGNLRLVLVVLFVLGLLHLLFAETPVVPVAWRAKPAPAFSGPFASNRVLEKIENWLPHLVGPEALTSDGSGRITTGLLDGRIVRIDPKARKVDVLANTHGRPLGMKYAPDGSLIVADAYKGLLRVDTRSGAVEILVDRYQGHRFRFTDDVDLWADGSLVFTDASMHFGLNEYELDALEHSNTGRVFAFDPRTRQLRVLARGLSFANGLAITADGSFALVSETWAYRVRRLFLSGPRRGQSEIVIDNLPGFPDNITYDRAHDLFWVALASPRDPGLDLLAPYPFIRRMVARLPRALRPAAGRHAMALAIRGNGQVVKFLDDPRSDSYSPITSVLALGDDLYFGSLQHAGLGHLAVRSR